MNTKLYLYGVVRTQNIEHSEKIITVQLPDFAQAFSLINFGEMGLVYEEKQMEDNVELRPTRKNLIHHQKVIEGLMPQFTVLPFSFGTVVDNIPKLETLISEQEDQFLKTLKEIEGKIELSLKIMWMNMGQVFAEVVEENPIIQLKREELFSSSNPDQNAKIELGKLVEEKLEVKRTEFQIKVINKLYEKAINYKVLKNIGEEMITNLVFLIEKTAEFAFDEAVNELSEELSENIKFKYVGPTPPYNFLEA